MSGVRVHTGRGDRGTRELSVAGAGMGSGTTSGFEPSSSRKSPMRSQFSVSGR